MNDMPKSFGSFEEQFTQGAHSYDLWKHDFTVRFNFHRCPSYRHILGRELAPLPTSNICPLFLALPFETWDLIENFSFNRKERRKRQ